MPRWLLPTALFVSLALNVFVVGAVVGQRMALARTPVASAAAPADARPRNPLAMALRELDPEQQSAWREAMRGYGQTAGQPAREGRRQLREAFESFGDPDFDAQATLAKMKAARALEQESRAAMDSRIVAFVATLPPADRARFGEALARGPARQGLGGRRAMGGGGEGGEGALADR